MPVGEWLIGHEWIKTEFHFDLPGIFDTSLPDLWYCPSKFSYQFEDKVIQGKKKTFNEKLIEYAKLKSFGGM